MSFVHLYQQSNLSLTHLQGKVVQCSVDQVRGNRVLLRTGLKDSTLCFQSELNSVQTVSNKATHNAIIAKQGMLSLVGIEHLEQFGEAKLRLPKSITKISRRKLVWAELINRWRGFNNRVKGFILNPVNGGYAVAIAGYIAFLPRSLRIGRAVFANQWRLFSILNMNARLRNIVVKEIRTRQARRRNLRLAIQTSQRHRSNIQDFSLEVNSKHKNRQDFNGNGNGKGKGLKSLSWSETTARASKISSETRGHSNTEFWYK